MDPAERDATLINEALKKATPDYKVIIEIVCTRNSEELLALKRSYHSLYKHCLEEDVASLTIGDIRKVCDSYNKNSFVMLHGQCFEQVQQNGM